MRFRCHTGHAYTADVLMAEQTKKVEETLWIALRMFEERKNLLTLMTNPKARGFTPSAAARLKESNVHITRIRAMLVSGTENATEAARSKINGTKAGKRKTEDVGRKR